MANDINRRLIGDFRQLMSDMTNGRVKSLPVFDDFYEGVTITDATGKICYINKMQLKIDDLDERLVVGRYVYEVYRVDEGISPTMQCLKSGEPKLNLACFYRTHLGKMINSIHNIFPLRWKGEIFGSICFIRDFQLTESSLEKLSEAARSLSAQESFSIPRKIGFVQKKNRTRYTFNDIIGKNSDLLQSIDVAQQASKSPCRYFFTGETGTGKELFAQSIRIPDLRDRLEDLDLLARHFVEKLNAHLGKNIPGLRAEVLERFKAHHWPGNVRELAHVIEEAMNLVQGNEPIGLQHISFHLTGELHKSKTALGPAENLSETAIPSLREPTKMVGASERSAFPKKGLISLQAEQEERIIRQALTATAAMSPGPPGNSSFPLNC